MILYFKVANYKSIKDELTVNFNASPVDDHRESNIIECNKLKLLRSILLCGHNASGKSTILDALFFFRNFIITSAVGQSIAQLIGVEPFALSTTTIQKPSFFEVAFSLGKYKRKYRYGFEADKEQIHKEWLLESVLKKEYQLFLRIGKSFQIDSKRFPNSKDLEKRTRKNALFLSVAAQWNVPKALEISTWFEKIYIVRGVMDRSYRNVTINLMKDGASIDIVNRFIRAADIGIDSVSLLGLCSPAVCALHNRYDDRSKTIDTIPFLLDDQESEGTINYFNILGILITAVQEGRLVVIDELDARLHALLSKSIIKLFNSSDVDSHAQLLAVSYNTALLDGDLLRRDQIYFVEKSSYGVTSVTSLVEFPKRKEARHEGGYLDGRYGAISVVNDK